MRGRASAVMILTGVLLGSTAVWAFDTSNYISLRDKKLVTISKTPNGVLVASTAHFDPSTGAPLTSTVEGVSVNTLTKQKAALQSQIDQINAALTDIQALGTITTP